MCARTAASDGGRTPTAHSILQLDVATPVPEGTDRRTPVHVRLGTEAMAGLLGKLDTIQAQMDKLS